MLSTTILSSLSHTLPRESVKAANRQSECYRKIRSRKKCYSPVPPLLKQATIGSAVGAGEGAVVGSAVGGGTGAELGGAVGEGTGAGLGGAVGAGTGAPVGGGATGAATGSGVGDGALLVKIFTAEIKG